MALSDIACEQDTTHLPRPDPSPAFATNINCLACKIVRAVEPSFAPQRRALLRTSLSMCEKALWNSSWAVSASLSRSG